MKLWDKIKILLKLNSAVDEIETEAKKMNGTKPGWQTTEFWGKVAVQVFTVYGAAKGFLSADKAALISSVIEGVYNLARAIVKYKGGTLPDAPAA